VVNKKLQIGAHRDLTVGHLITRRLLIAEPDAATGKSFEIPRSSILTRFNRQNHGSQQPV
jgi:hypothetical protein